MNVYIAYGYAGEHIAGVFATKAGAVEALRAEARKYGHLEAEVEQIDGTDAHDLDGFTVDIHEVQP